MKTEKIWGKLLLIAGLIVLMFFVLFPFFWLVICSIKLADEIFALVPSLIPPTVTFTRYRYGTLSRSWARWRSMMKSWYSPVATLSRLSRKWQM